MASSFTVFWVEVDACGIKSDRRWWGVQYFPKVWTRQGHRYRLSLFITFWTNQIAVREYRLTQSCDVAIVIGNLLRCYVPNDVVLKELEKVKGDSKPKFV